MAAVKKPQTALSKLIKLLWRQPLFAIPFAFFFSLLFGRGRGSFLIAYEISLVFAYLIAFAIWATEFFVYPALERRGFFAGRGSGPNTAFLFMGVSVFASLVSAMVVHFTIVPGFMGNARSIAIVMVFALLFGALFIGINMATYYYRESLNRARADQELDLARRIQRSFLLTQFPEMSRVELHAVNLSSKEVSGDFYDVVPAGDGAYLLAIADVAGKGVPAALLTSMLQASLRTQAGSIHSVAQILYNINRLTYRSTAVNQFATFFLARIDENSLTLTFSNAGHNYPVVFRDDGAKEMLVRGGVVVGILEDASFEEATVELRPGDRLVFYTDGVSEAESPTGELFGEDRLYELVTGLPRSLRASEVTDRILAAVSAHQGGTEATDDITLMVLRVREQAALPAPVLLSS